MTNLHAPPAPAGTSPCGAMDIRRLAARAWMEMDRAGVLPTPAHFELWYIHLGGSNPQLSRQLTSLLENAAAPLDAALDDLRAEYLVPDMEGEGLAGSSEELQQAAKVVMDQVAGNQDALRAYSDTLSQVAGQLDQDGTIGSLLQAVTTLTGETTRASERNRTLEQQLSAAVAKIDRLRQNLAEVKQIATTDALTGLSNRRSFDCRLRMAIMRAKASGSPLALLLLDVDHFKRFNDEHGHKVGDLVLRLVGRQLTSNIKGRDIAARYGGEEFAVVLTETDLRAGLIVAEQMRAAFDGKHLVNHGTARRIGSVTVSIGVAQLRPGDGPATIVGRADAALYDAKGTGRNRVCAEEGCGPVSSRPEAAELDQRTVPAIG